MEFNPLIISSTYLTCFHQDTSDYFFHLPLSLSFLITQAQKKWVSLLSYQELVHYAQPLIC